jgi:hypothetical protein
MQLQSVETALAPQVTYPDSEVAAVRIAHSLTCIGTLFKYLKGLPQELCESVLQVRKLITTHTHAHMCLRNPLGAVLFNVLMT